MAAERVSAEELHELLQQADKPLIIDVRKKSSYEEGHVPGAVNIPLSQLENELANLPKDRPIVTYCGGGTSGVKAANLLAEKGYDARVMAGFRSWKAAELPVETGQAQAQA